MFFQEKEMKTLSPSLFLSPSLLPLPNTVELIPLPLSITLILSQTVSHPVPPSLLSHLSLLSSLGTSMCFSLIEMHFNVVQISFLQLQSKLVTCVCVCAHACMCNLCICVCVNLCICVCVCQKFPQLKARLSC